MVYTINARMEVLEATFRVQSASWTDAGNLVLIVPTPNDAHEMAAGFEQWSPSLPMKASHAQLDSKAHQIVVQRAYLRNDLEKLIVTEPPFVPQETYTYL